MGKRSTISISIDTTEPLAFDSFLIDVIRRALEVPDTSMKLDVVNYFKEDP